MDISSIHAFAFEHLNDLPSWFKTVLLISLSCRLLKRPLGTLIGTLWSILQSPKTHACGRAVRRIGNRVWTYVCARVDDPLLNATNCPRLHRFVLCMQVVSSYGMAGLLFLVYLGIALLWTVQWFFAKTPLSPFQHAGIGAYLFLCLFVGTVNKTQGSKALLALRSQRQA
jgi:hypothetical protein